MEFYRDRKKTTTLLLWCSGILILCVAAFLFAIGLFDGKVGVKLAVFSGVFSVILLVVIISKLLSLRDPSPLVVLSSDGIISKTTPVSKAAGLILWKDIVDVHLQKMSGDHLVTLTVVDHDHYLPLIKKKISGIVTKNLADYNGNLPISLTASEITIDAQELYRLITDFKKEIQ